MLCAIASVIFAVWFAFDLYLRKRAKDETGDGSVIAFDRTKKTFAVTYAGGVKEEFSFSELKDASLVTSRKNFEKGCFDGLCGVHLLKETAEELTVPVMLVATVESGPLTRDVRIGFTQKRMRTARKWLEIMQGVIEGTARGQTAGRAGG